jgi:hypothetical protein
MVFDSNTPYGHLLREEQEDDSASRKLSLVIIALNLILAGSLYGRVDQPQKQTSRKDES